MAMFLTACGKPEAGKPQVRDGGAVPVSTVPVSSTNLDRTITVVGTLFPKDEAILGAEVEGRVEKTTVDFGDRIQAGQLLAQIDTTTYEALARQAEANVARAYANATNAEHNLARMRELQKNSISSASDLDKATADHGQTEAEVKAAEAAYGLAKLNVERSRVRAPFEAAISDRIASAGDFVKVGAPLFRVVNDALLKYIVQVPERFAADIKKDQLVRFNVDAYPGETFEGRVLLISPQISAGTRAMNFGALVQNQNRRLKASAFARGEVVVENNVPTLVVPLEAVVTMAGVTRVFVIEKDQAHARSVKIGRVLSGQQEILSGVKEGELVAVSGQSKLYEGAKVVGKR